MGSDHHYAEEAPTHRVTVGGFWMGAIPEALAPSSVMFKKAPGRWTSATTTTGGRTLRAPTGAIRADPARRYFVAGNRLAHSPIGSLSAMNAFQSLAVRDERRAAKR